MSTIASIMGQNVKKGDLGIEIETEAKRAYDVPRKELALGGWTYKTDGSLRDFGIEYVSDGPIPKEDINTHLTNWKSALGKIHSQLVPDSISTSVHVHINIQHLTPIQCLNFYILSVVFENVLAKFAGPDREGNLFALRTKDSEVHFHYLKREIKDALSELDVVRAFNPGRQDKVYTNIHTIPVNTFGSIEFRVMRGTTDTDEIELWVNALVNVREYSLQFSTPLDILRAFRDSGPENMFIQAVGQHAGRFLYEGFEKDIQKNYYYLAELAMCRKSWEFARSKPKVSAPALRITPVVQGVADDGQVITWDEDFIEEDF